MVIIVEAAVATEEIVIIVETAVVIEEIVIIISEKRIVEEVAVVTDIINVLHLVEVTTTNEEDGAAANPSSWLILFFCFKCSMKIGCNFTSI